MNIGKSVSSIKDILGNDNHSLFKDLGIFSKEQLSELLDNYKVPKFNADHAFRRKNMAEVYFFDKPLLINELKWVS